MDNPAHEKATDFIAAIKEAQVQASQSAKVSLLERLARLGKDDHIRLQGLAMVGENLSLSAVQDLWSLQNLALPDVEMQTCLINGVAMGLIEARLLETGDVFFQIPEPIRKIVLDGKNPAETRTLHHAAEGLYLRMFVGLYRELMEKEPQPQDDLTQLRQNLLAPGGFVDQLAHHPEWRNMHEAVVARSVAWLTHLLALGLVQEAASLANVVVFSLARQGHRRLALGMLAQVISASQGLTRMIAAINLATLHREAGELDTASKLYWQLVPALIRSRAWRPLGAVLSELGVIATYRGHHLQAVLMLEATVELRGWVGDPKGQAISRQQLSTAYRGMGMYGAALKVNCQAETYFRASKDQLNLGRTLMAQGNLMNLSHKPDIALARFEEAGSIGEQIEDPLAAIGSLSGRARAYQQLGELDQARCLLEEAIGRRQRSTAYGHYVGVEYENMGGLYEQQGNLGLALAWYRKALAQFERHQPGETIRCKRKIRTIEARLKKSG